MSAAVAEKPEVWDPKVIALAERYGLRPYLSDFLTTARRLFPETRAVRVYTEQDPEIDDLAFLIFELRLPPIDNVMLRDRDRAWGDHFFDTVPPPYWISPVLRFRFDE